MLRRFTSERIRKARRKRLTISLVLWSVFVASLMFLVVEIVDLPELRIETVSFSGNRVLIEEALFAVVEPHLEGNHAFFFPKRNSFLYPREAIEASLLESFVKIESVRVDRRGLSRIHIAITEREPFALWCAPQGTRSCYFVDETGIAFALAPRLSGGSFVAHHKDMPIDPLGMHITSEEHFRELASLTEFLMTLGLTARRITWKPGFLDVLVHVKTSAGDYETSIFIPEQAPYEQSLNSLASILDGFDFTNVEYIDVRFENKVFYKELEAMSYELEGEEIESGE